MKETRIVHTCRNGSMHRFCRGSYQQVAIKLQSKIAKSTNKAKYILGVNQICKPNVHVWSCNSTRSSLDSDSFTLWVHSTWHEQQFPVATKFKQAQRAANSGAYCRRRHPNGHMQLAGGHYKCARPDSFTWSSESRSISNTHRDQPTQLPQVQSARKRHAMKHSKRPMHSHYA